MRCSPALLLATTALAGAVLPASASAASWTPSRAATSRGVAFEPSVAADARGRLAMGWMRRLGSDNRAEVRQGTLRAGLRGDANVLDSVARNMDSVTVGFGADGVLAVMWRRLLNRAQRIRGATVSTGGSTSGPFELTGDGTQSAYDPRLVAGADGSLRGVWARRSTSESALVTGTSFGSPVALPSPGNGVAPAVVVDRDGTTVVAWADRGRMLTAQAPAGGAFAPTVALADLGYARDPQLALTAAGAVVAVWTASAGHGNALIGAVRPPGEAGFGAGFPIVGETAHATGPRLAATSAGEVLVAYVSSRTERAYGSSSGRVQMARLGADGRPAGGPPVLLSPDGVRAISPAIASDGTGSAFAGWSDARPGRRAVQVRRIAPGAILGAVRTLGGGDIASSAPPVLAGAAGRGVAAWVRSGHVRYSVYR
jgi:hypothetical protein